MYLDVFLWSLHLERVFMVDLTFSLDLNAV